MKSKTISLFALSIFALVVFASLASAAISFSNVPELSIAPGIHSYDVSVSGETSVTLSPNPTTIIEGTKSFIVSSTYNSSAHTINISYIVPTDFKFNFEKSASGLYFVTLNATNSSDSTSAPQSIFFQEVPFYDGENEGDLEISNLEFNTLEGFGDDEDFWYPLDEVEITFDVDNQGDWDIENIEIWACLWDKDAKKCIFDEDDMDISENDFNLDEGDDEQTVTMTFQVDIDKLTPGNKDYALYVKAVGNINDNNAPDDIDGDDTGDSTSKNILIETDDQFVILSDIEVPESASCGSIVTISADAWNIENSNQKDVYVNIYNKELGIDEDVDVGDINDFDKEAFTFDLELPLNVAEKTYYLTLTVYDDNGDVYETNENNDQAVSSVPLKLEGSCSTQSKVSVVASLESKAVSGKELVVKATILNTGKESADYSLKVADYANWADSVKLSEDSLTLNVGESEDVLITLDVKSGISGEKAFNLEILSGNELVVTQPISVTISETGKAFSLTGFFASLGGSNNTYLWAIGALNLVLVLIIIAVAVKVIRKK